MGENDILSELIHRALGQAERAHHWHVQDANHAGALLQSCPQCQPLYEVIQNLRQACTLVAVAAAQVPRGAHAHTGTERHN